MKNPQNSSWWKKLSNNYLEKIQRIVSLIIDKIITNDGKFGVKIPIEPIKDIEYSTIIDIFESLSERHKLFFVLNEKYKRLLRETENPDSVDWDKKMQMLKDTYYKFGFIEEDLDKYVLIEIRNSKIIDELKTLEEKIDKKIKKRTNFINLELPSGWEWENRKKGIYQFGKIRFIQTGRIRKKVFTALIDTFEKSPQAISIQSLHEKTSIKPNRIRIEINAINKRLISKVGIYFKGSGKGFYTLEKIPSFIPPSIQ